MPAQSVDVMAWSFMSVKEISGGAANVDLYGLMSAKSTLFLVFDHADRHAAVNPKNIHFFGLTAAP